MMISELLDRWLRDPESLTDAEEDQVFDELMQRFNEGYTAITGRSFVDDLNALEAAEAADDWDAEERTMPWIRYRFTSNLEDYRPVIFPPSGPFWCTGSDPEGNAILVAYLRPEDQLETFWPEAEHIDSQPAETLTFTSRFPKPQWYTGQIS